MDTMDRVFVCHECGRQTAYQPEECSVLTRYEVVGGKVEVSRSLLVFCAG